MEHADLHGGTSSSGSVSAGCYACSGGPRNQAWVCHSSPLAANAMGSAVRRPPC